MGMYTEIYTKITFNEDLPELVVDIIKTMIGEGDDNKVIDLPKHPLFECSRWKWMLRSCSYYHQPKGVGSFWFDDIGNNWYLLSRSDLKNYDGEIAKFFDWISPYVENNRHGKTFIGYELYEEDTEPKLYYI